MYLSQTGSIWSLKPILMMLTSLQQAAVGDSSLSQAPQGPAQAHICASAPRAVEREAGLPGRVRSGVG